MGVVFCSLFHHLIWADGLKAITLDNVSGTYAICRDCGAEYFEARHRVIRIG